MAIEVHEIALAFHEITRWAFHARKGGPNTRCPSSHASSRGELRDHAHSASNMNGVAGTAGKITPATPRPKNTQPSAT